MLPGAGRDPVQKPKSGSNQAPWGTGRRQDRSRGLGDQGEGIPTLSVHGRAQQGTPERGKESAGEDGPQGTPQRDGQGGAGTGGLLGHNPVTCCPSTAPGSPPCKGYFHPRSLGGWLCSLQVQQGASSCPTPQQGLGDLFSEARELGLDVRGPFLSSSPYKHQEAEWCRGNSPGTGETPGEVSWWQKPNSSK